MVGDEDILHIITEYVGGVWFVADALHPKQHGMFDLHKVNRKLKPTGSTKTVPYFAVVLQFHRLKQ